jgi:hypothetical protein
MYEMTLISMNKYLIEVNHFKYEIIWQNMQENISDICLQFGSEYPSQGQPAYGQILLRIIYKKPIPHIYDTIAELLKMAALYLFQNIFIIFT